jgi:hypothetical protein
MRRKTGTVTESALRTGTVTVSKTVAVPVFFGVGLETVAVPVFADMWLLSHSGRTENRGGRATVVCSPADHKHVSETASHYDSMTCTIIPQPAKAGRSFAELGAVPRFV